MQYHNQNNICWLSKLEIHQAYLLLAVILRSSSSSSHAKLPWKLYCVLFVIPYFIQSAEEKGKKMEQLYI